MVLTENAVRLPTQSGAAAIGCQLLQRCGRVQLKRGLLQAHARMSNTKNRKPFRPYPLASLLQHRLAVCSHHTKPTPATRHNIDCSQRSTPYPFN